MRRVWVALHIVSVVLFGSIGCNQAPKRPEIKAPKEDFHIPPPGVGAQPGKYPDDMLNRVPLRKQKDDDQMPPMGTGPGMGGGGTPGGGGLSTGGRPGI